jgi:CysZ protein
MFSALSRAFAQLPRPEMRGPLIRSVAWAGLAFVFLWWGLAALIHHELVREQRWVEILAGILGVFAAPVVTWLLFPSVVLIVLGFYSEAIIQAVERRHYPNLATPSESRQVANLWSGIRLALIGLALNILALPLYLLFPGLNLVLFLGLNGYLLGREYFDVVALRRADWQATQRLWRSHRVTFILSGVVVAGLFALPVVNLVAPIIGLAAAVHLVERFRGSDPARREIA